MWGRRIQCSSTSGFWAGVLNYEEGVVEEGSLEWWGDMNSLLSLVKYLSVSLLLGIIDFIGCSQGCWLIQKALFDRHYWIFFKPTETIKCLVDIWTTNQTLLWIPMLCIILWTVVYGPTIKILSLNYICICCKLGLHYLFEKKMPSGKEKVTVMLSIQLSVVAGIHKNACFPFMWCICSQEGILHQLDLKPTFCICD